MGVVAEALDELLDVLVHERVDRDLVDPLVELRLGRELAVDQQVGDLHLGAALDVPGQQAAAPDEGAGLLEHGRPEPVAVPGVVHVDDPVQLGARLLAGPRAVGEPAAHLGVAVEEGEVVEVGAGELPEDQPLGLDDDALHAGMLAEGRRLVSRIERP